MITYNELGALLEIATRSPLSTAERIWVDGLAERIATDRQKTIAQKRADAQLSAQEDDKEIVTPTGVQEPALNGKPKSP